MFHFAAAGDFVDGPPTVSSIADGVAGVACLSSLGPHFSRPLISYIDLGDATH